MRRTITVADFEVGQVVFLPVDDRLLKSRIIEIREVVDRGVHFKCVTWKPVSSWMSSRNWQFYCAFKDWTAEYEMYVRPEKQG